MVFRCPPDPRLAGAARFLSEHLFDGPPLLTLEGRPCSQELANLFADFPLPSLRVHLNVEAAGADSDVAQGGIVPFPVQTIPLLLPFKGNALQTAFPVSFSIVEEILPESGKDEHAEPLHRF